MMVLPSSMGRPSLFRDSMTGMDPDLALLERWRGGERQAGEDLFERHFPELCRFFEHKVGDDGDDLVQRTFLACVKARDEFRSESSFRTYLFTIARHELYAHYRRHTGNAAIDFEITSLARLSTTLGSRMVRAEEAQRLRGALAELPAEQQLILELHYWHDLDAAALASVLEVPAGTIRVRLFRARAALKARLVCCQTELATANDRLTAALGEPDLELDTPAG
jgi:RNA polymerase sigma factor (sigma-70 family)